MADRLTQLQEAVNHLADYFCNSIGILQQPQEANQTEADVKNVQGPEKNIQLFASIITRTALDIDILIDSLPSNDYTLEKQTETLKKLEAGNQDSAAYLQQVVTEAETLLSQVRDANREVSNKQLQLDHTSQ